MIGGVARVTAKQYRLELALCVALGLVVAALGSWVVARLLGVGVPVACAGLNLDDPTSIGGCWPSLQAFSRIYYDDASKALAAMAILPIAAGLLGGVPIVGRELEAGTAQFAWAISPSRLRWLMRQLSIVGLILLLAIGLPAVVTNVLETTRRAVMPASPFENVGLYGLVSMTKVAAALMVGMLVGAVTGRTLPAFIVGALVMMAAVGLAGAARDAWAVAQPSIIVADESVATFDGQLVAAGWVDESGKLLSYEQGIAQAPSGVDDPDMWLWDNGYYQVQLGIPSAVASQWAAIEATGWLLGAGGALVAGAWVTTRRRPG